jgi:hypothetical protein
MNPPEQTTTEVQTKVTLTNHRQTIMSPDVPYVHINMPNLSLGKEIIRDVYQFGGTIVRVVRMVSIVTVLALRMGKGAPILPGIRNRGYSIHGDPGNGMYTLNHGMTGKKLTNDTWTPDLATRTPPYPDIRWYENNGRHRDIR